MSVQIPFAIARAGSGERMLIEDADESGVLYSISVVLTECTDYESDTPASVQVRFETEAGVLGARSNVAPGKPATFLGRKIRICGDVSVKGFYVIHGVFPPGWKP